MKVISAVVQRGVSQVPGARLVIAVSHGNDLIEFQAAIDARSQRTEAQAVAWSPGEQAVLQGTATAELSASGQTTVKGALIMIN